MTIDGPESHHKSISIAQTNEIQKKRTIKRFCGKMWIFFYDFFISNKWVTFSIDLSSKEWLIFVESLEEKNHINSLKLSSINDILLECLKKNKWQLCLYWIVFCFVCLKDQCTIYLYILRLRNVIRTNMVCDTNQNYFMDFV